MMLGEKILKLRKERGFSQERLGEKVNVTRQTISNWELGETSPNPEQLKLLSKELNVSIDELLDNKDIKKDNIKKQKNTNTFKVVAKYIGMFFADIFTGAGFILLYAWLLVMILFSIALMVVSICLIAQFNIENIIPYMPYWCGIITSTSLICLSVLFVVCSILYSAFVTKLLKSYIQIHHSIFDKEYKKEMINKEIKSNKILSNKKLILATKIFLISFIILFMIAFIVCIISAENLSFWHTWNWWL